MEFKLYDEVRLKAFNVAVPSADAFNLRPPAVGDVATIVEIYSSPPGFELECSDADGITQWFISFGAEEVQLELRR